LGSIGIFLAELFFMGVIFAGVALLVRYVLQQTVDHDQADTASDRPTRTSRKLLPLLEKHQD